MAEQPMGATGFQPAVQQSNQALAKPEGGGVFKLIPKNSSIPLYWFDLTPTLVAWILRQARSGYSRQYFELLDDVLEKNPRIRSEMLKRQLAVALTEIEIEPAGKDARSIQIADFVQAEIEGCENKVEGISHLDKAVWSSIALTEIVWETMPNGGWHLRKLDPWDSRFLIIDSFNGIQRQDYTAGFVQPEPNKWITHTCPVDGYIMKGGLGRTLVWFHMFQNFSLKDWISFMEIYGMPFRKGTYKSGAPNEDIERLTTAVLETAVSQGVVFSDACQVEFIQAAAASTGEAFEKFRQQINEEISILINGQVMTTQGSSQGKGTNALGKVHQDVKEEIRQLDCKRIAETLQRDLVVPLVIANFGVQAKYPQFKFRYQNEEDAVQNVQVLEEAVNKLGIPVSLDEARTKLGLTSPNEGDALCVAQPKPAPFTPGMPAKAFHAKAKHNHPYHNSIDGVVPGVIDEAGPLYQELIADLKAQYQAGIDPSKMSINKVKYAEFMVNKMLMADLLGRVKELKDDGIKADQIKTQTFSAGGAGSGNFSHEGRPGEVGGSGEGGEKGITETRQQLMDMLNSPSPGMSEATKAVQPEKTKTRIIKVNRESSERTQCDIDNLKRGILRREIDNPNNPELNGLRQELANKIYAFSKYKIVWETDDEENLSNENTWS